MSLWTDIRDAAESIAVVVGNYYLPGSSMLTSKLVSEGSQEQLSSDLGVLAQLTSGGLGAAQGNLSNYGKIFGSGSAGTTAGSPGTGLATDTQTGLIAEDGSVFRSDLTISERANLAQNEMSSRISTGQLDMTKPVMNSFSATPTTTAANTLSSAPADVSAYTNNTGIINGASTSASTPLTPAAKPGVWDKIGTFLEKPGNVMAVGLGIQGTGAIMAGMGAAEQAKIAKEKQDRENAEKERQLANINSPSYNPVRARARPGIINSRSVLA